jgi:hypothetical protein
LGLQKAAKLVFSYRYLRGKEDIDWWTTWLNNWNLKKYEKKKKKKKQTFVRRTDTLREDWFTK